MLDPFGTCYSRARPEGDGGTAETAVLIHGVGLDASMWDRQWPALSRRLPVVRYDMLGHGGSVSPLAQRRLEDFVLQLRRLVDHLALERVSVVGFSMGGLVAKAFAIDQPERCARLVIANTVHGRTPEHTADVLKRVDAVLRHGPAANVEAALRRWFSADFARRCPDAIDAVRKRLSTNDHHGYLEAYRVFATADAEVEPHIARICCPTLIITGEEDANSTPAMARALAQRIAGAKLRILERQRHMMPVEAADAVNRILLEFLVPAPTSGGPGKGKH